MAANPFDEFDAPAPAANPFDEFDSASEEKRHAAQDAEIRREMAMKPEEYDRHIREKVRAGGYYRPQPGQFGLLSGQVTDAIGLEDEISGIGQFLRRFATSGGSLDEAGKAYTDAAERIRAERRVAREMNGIAPEVVGGMGTTALRSVPAAFAAVRSLGSVLPGSGAPVAQQAAALRSALAPTAAAPSGFLPTALESAKAGGIAGLATGAAQGEGGTLNRAGAAAEGAAFGAALGPAISNVAVPAATRLYGAGKSALRHGNRAVRSYSNPEQVAIGNVADRMVATGLDPAAARAAVSPPPSPQLAGRNTPAGRPFNEADMADIISRQMAGESAASVGQSYGISGGAARRYLALYRDQNPTPMNIIDIAKDIQGEGRSGPLGRLGRAAHGLAGDESADAAQALLSRQETQPGRVSGIARQAVGGRDYEATLQAGRQQLRQEADQAYRGFYQEPDLATGELGDLMEDQVFRQAVTNARDQARADAIARNQEAARAGRPLEPVPYSAKNDPQLVPLQRELEETQDALRAARRRRQDANSADERRAALEESRQHEDAITAIQREMKEISETPDEVFSPQMLDYIQRQLRITAEGRVSNPTAAQHAGNLRQVFLDRIEQHYQTFRGIRRQYAERMGEFGEEGALQSGREMTRRLGERADVALREFDAMTPAQQDLFRLGFARQIMDDAANTQVGGAVANKFRKGAVDEIVRRIWSGNANLDAQGESLLRNLRREAITTKTKNDVLSGSRTAEYEGDMGRMMEGAQAAANLATGRFGKLLGDLSTRLTTQLGRRGATETMRILTETDPARLLPLLNRLEQAARNTSQRQQLVHQLREIRATGQPGVAAQLGISGGRQP
jgi:hypothetical protein